MEEEIILKGSRKVVIKRFFVYKCKIMLSKVLFSGKKTRWPFARLLTRVVIVGSSK